VIFIHITFLRTYTRLGSDSTAGADRAADDADDADWADEDGA